MNHAALKALIDTDPDNAAASDAAVLEWLKGPADTARRMDLGMFVTRLDDIGKLAGIQAAAADGNPAALGLVSLARTMRDYGRQSINFSKGRHADRMQALVDGGFITAEERAAIEAEATTEVTPRWPGRVVLGDVIAARAL